MFSPRKFGKTHLPEPSSHLRGGFVSPSPSPAPCSLLPSAMPWRGGDASHGHCSLKQTDIKTPKPHKPAILGSPRANITALFLSLEPCASPSPHPLRPVTKCLPVAPPCTPQAASSSSSSSYSSSQWWKANISEPDCNAVFSWGADKCGGKHKRNLIPPHEGQNHTILFQ